MSGLRLDIEDVADDVDLKLAGRFCTWYDEQRGQFALVTGRLRLRVRLHCARCKRAGLTVFVGLGAPGWCYAWNRHGEFLADLREREFVCAACAGRENEPG